MIKTTWEDTKWGYNATASENGDFISISSKSDYGMELDEPIAPEYILNLDISDKDLGLVIIKALKNSQKITLEEAKVLYQSFETSYKKWIQKLMNQFGYKTKNALFRKMKSCSITCKNGTITIRPSHHKKLELWTGDFIIENDHVKIPADSSPAEIGAALRLAFSRCTGMGA